MLLNGTTPIVREARAAELFVSGADHVAQAIAEEAQRAARVSLGQRRPSAIDDLRVPVFGHPRGRRGLVSFVRAADGGGSVYFLTSRGIRAVKLIAERTAPRRRKLIPPEQAVGPLRAHTLAVNETGIAFMQAARDHGDEFGTLAWQHEIAHPIGHCECLIADALLTYLQYEEDGELRFHYRLLEVDRANLPTEVLAGKLARYARLYNYAPADGRKPAWQARYEVFPGVICVLAGKDDAALERRMQSVLALCRQDPALRRPPEVEISICLLSDLVAQGPFAAIWQRPEQEQRLDWLGNPPQSQTSDS
jgi:protein involved in plasmid replication-relaxation